jgi:predicted nucleic acid-binding protein
MGKGFLIDTNAVIDFTMRSLPIKGQQFMAEVLDGQPTISVIVEIELLGFPSVDAVIAEFVKRTTVLQLDQVVIRQTILLRQKQRIKLPDAIIAATAIVHDLTLITRNTKDFVKVKGLKVVNPHEV